MLQTPKTNMSYVKAEKKVFSGKLHPIHLLNHRILRIKNVQSSCLL